MLRSTFELTGYRIAARDGDIGRAHDVFFDDQEWTVRYLVVDTGHWLPGRRVLLTPEAVGPIDWNEHHVPVSLTREQIEKSPPVDADKPVSRQQEIELHRYFAWTPYWGAGMMGPYTEPAGLAVPPTAGEEIEQGDAHLRSARHVKGYHIAAADGDIGHIDDFILEEENWIIRYVVADTRNWLPGKKVLVSPWWFKAIGWAERKVATDLKQEDIRKGPHYDPSQPVNREYEERLYDFHGRPKYWA